MVTPAAPVVRRLTRGELVGKNPRLGGSLGPSKIPGGPSPCLMSRIGNLNGPAEPGHRSSVGFLPCHATSASVAQKLIQQHFEGRNEDSPGPVTNGVGTTREFGKSARVRKRPGYFLWCGKSGGTGGRCRVYLRYPLLTIALTDIAPTSGVQSRSECDCAF